MLRTQQTLLVKPYRAGQVRVVCLVVGKVGDESVEEGDVAIIAVGGGMVALGR
jgi:hypothetical protein